MRHRFLEAEVGDVYPATLGSDSCDQACRCVVRSTEHGSILILTDGHMPGIDLTIASTVDGYGGIEQGRGRIKSITLDTTVHGRGTPHRSGRYTLTAPTFGETGLRWTPAPAADLAGHRPVAVAQ